MFLTEKRKKLPSLSLLQCHVIALCDLEFMNHISLFFLLFCLLGHHPCIKKIPWRRGYPLQSVGSQRVRHEWVTFNLHTHTHTHTHTYIGCCCLVTQLYLTLYNLMDCSPPGSSVHEIFQARILGVGCHFLFQRIFPTQGSSLSLLHWQADSLLRSHQGSPDIHIKLTHFAIHLKPTQHYKSTMLR